MCRSPGMAAHGEIMISEAVHAQAGHAIDVVPAGDHVLKGFLKPIPVFRISGLKVRGQQDLVAGPSATRPSP